MKTLFERMSEAQREPSTDREKIEAVARATLDDEAINVANNGVGLSMAMLEELGVTTKADDIRAALATPNAQEGEGA